MTDKRRMRAMHKRHKEAADWVFRNKEAGHAASEDASFREWLRDPKNCRAYEAAERLLGEARTAINSYKDLKDFELEPRSLKKPIVGTILLLVVAGALFVSMDGPLYIQADVVSGVSEMPVVTLSDGSTLQLNASSAIAYDYTATQRTIRLLRGQAFFQVAKDQHRPFVVEADKARVTALGTAFDVRLAYEKTDVTVTESTVLLQADDGDHDGVQVTEGQQAVLDHKSGKADVRSVDGQTALVWRHGQLAVDNAPLSFIVEEMNRHFAGKIMLVGKDLSNRPVSGTVAVADTQAALSFIEQVLRLKVTRIGPLIIVRG